ncbi:MAG: TetR/AcrR family transcriptional regulator [Rhodocyclaceae bacterium]|jgi:AcrR family transcriptional regulator
MTTERKTRSSTPRTQLDRNDWIEAAIEVLADQGVAGLRVEVLAKNFGVTKGSFYWHFKDRQDLLNAVLQEWKEGRLRDIEKQSTAVPGKEMEQIHHVIDVYSAVRNRKGISIELAVRDWARHDPAISAVVEEVDSYRLECTRKLFVSLGLSDDEARARSILVFAYVFGHSLMAYDRSNPKVPEFKRWIAERITGR